MIEKIILKKSSVLDKMPTAEQLDYGEIALNYNAEHPFISFKDSDGDVMPLNDYSQDIAYLYSHKLDAGVLDTINENSDAIKKKLNITDFNTFKADNTKTINALDRNVSQNGSEIQEVNGIVQNHTTAIAQKADKTDIDTINAKVDKKVSKTDIVQDPGQSTTSVMSQKAVSDALSTKVDKSDIVQSTGTSTTAVMSQKASTDSFIANTPSGDPMHNMYVAIGAEWNGSGVDKTYPTPWADYAEDEEDKVCVHKTGHWKFYDVGDLTNSDMIYVYRDFGLNIKFTNLQFIESTSRIISLGWHNDAKSFLNDGYEPFALCLNLIEIVFYKNKTGIVNIQGNCAYFSAFSSKLKYIYGNLNFTESISNTSFINCLDLRIIFVNNLRSSISFKDSPKLSKHCVRYMIENATDATITITLHQEAYDRAIADAGVQAALANKTNVSLAKAE